MWQQSLITFLLCATSSALPAVSVPVATSRKHDRISWAKCDAKWNLPSKLECANLTVPIDWDAPDDGDTITLGMTRWARPSNSSSERLGYLFINPGGPGLSAVDFLAAMSQFRLDITANLTQRFDLIAVDPRGVGHSAASNCSASIFNERVSLFPKSKEEFQRLVEKNRRLGESCRSKTGKIIDYLDTVSAAKDHEAIRAALGQNEQMNWLGLSYGTQLGAQYAQLYPQNVRAMVLDGVLQHSQSEASNILTESTAYAAELEAFFTWAASDDSSWLRGKNVSEVWTTILDTSSNSPIPAPGCDEISCRSDVTAEEILFNSQELIRDFGYFAYVLYQASQGNATLLSTKLASDTSIDLYATTTIACQDWSPSLTSLTSLLAKQRIGATFSPLTRGACAAYALQASCIGWPSQARNPPTKLHIPKTDIPVLLVNSVRDPSTSYTWAVGMLEEIGNAVLLTRLGDGHTSYARGGEASRVINDYLITGKVERLLVES